MEVIKACSTFFLYAVTAVFAENAVFGRAMGVSRLVKLVEACFFAYSFQINREKEAELLEKKPDMLYYFI